MKFLFATGRAHLPDQVGGAERSVHTLLELLCENGHECEAVVGLRRGWRRRVVRHAHLLSAGQLLRLTDRHNGYPTHRTAAWLIPKLTRHRLRKFQPDFVITQLERSNEIAETALAHATRVALMVRNAEFDRQLWPRPSPGLKYISNSNFIAARVRERFNLESEVIYGIIRLERYRVETHNPEYLTFINPLPLKGLDLALALAALLPQRRFLFVEGWRMAARLRHQLESRLESVPNVTLSPWTSDMREVYTRTAILLVPSQWEEAFGRVALEAQVSGIPVIGRDIGGLSEVLQESGTLLARDAPPQVWADAVERLLSDTALYAARSAAARANAERPIFDPHRQLERFLELVSHW
jgi:glycosyltransferase involved in cell wall biosynthesis